MFCSPVEIDFFWFIFEHVAPATCCVKNKRVLFVDDFVVKDCHIRFPLYLWMCVSVGLIFKKLAMMKKKPQQLNNNLVPVWKKQSLNLGYLSMEHRTGLHHGSPVIS